MSAMRSIRIDHKQRIGHGWRGEPAPIELR